MGRKKQIMVRLITLGDQVCFSVANFLLSIILARFYTEVELAAYVIGISIALTIQGIQRNCYVLQNSVLAPEILRRRASKVLGQQFWAWAILLIIEGMVALSVFALTDERYLHYIAVSAIVSTLMFTQLEFDRIIFIKHDKYIHAAAASIGFLIFTIVMMFLVPLMGISFYALMVMIGVYMIFKMLWLFVSTKWPDLFWGWRLLKRDFRGYFLGSVVGVLGYAGHNHVPLFVLGWYAAPIHAAAFGAMRGLIQPLQIVARSLDIIDKNLFQVRVKNAGGMRLVLLRQMAAYSALAFFIFLGAIFFGEFIIQLAYGQTYAAYSDILIGWVFIFAMLSVTFPLETVIVKLDKLNTYNNGRILAGLVGTILAFFLWEDYGAMGAVVASLAGWVVSVACALWIVSPVLCGKVK